MLRRIRRATETVRFCDTCSQVSTAADRSERRFSDHRDRVLVALTVLR